MKDLKLGVTVREYNIGARQIMDWRRIHRKSRQKEIGNGNVECGIIREMGDGSVIEYRGSSNMACFGRGYVSEHSL